MSGKRWTVMGLAHPRAGWFSELARWSTSAAVPIDFVKCMSASEVQVRLSGGRAYSALLVGDRVSGVDRDLVDAATTAGTAVIVVDPTVHRNWTDLGVSGVLPSPFSRADLISALEQHASPIATLTSSVTGGEINTPVLSGSWHGSLVAVTGSGGVGQSVTAMALSQALAGRSGNRGMVLLADLALDADLAMLHDARDVIPSIQEFAEAHRVGRMTVEDTRSMTFDVPQRGYQLMLGLRHHRDWTVLRERSFAASLDTMLRSFRVVVADITGDFEGEPETGSADVADRNLMSRSVIQRADVVVAIGAHGVKGVLSLARTIRSLLAVDAEPQRIVPVINRAPRSPSKRAESTRALAALLDSADLSEHLNGPVFVPERRDLEVALRDGIRVPTALGAPVLGEVVRRLESEPSRAELPLDLEPQLIRPGTLGTWTEDVG